MSPQSTAQHPAAPRNRRRPRVVLLLGASLLLAAPIRSAHAACSACPGSGYTMLGGVKLRGNDLDELWGGCAPPHGTVELYVSQEHLSREQVCPPSCPSNSPYRACINGCQNILVATATADAYGNFRFRHLDSLQSVQMVATVPNQPAGLDGVYTSLAVRAYDPVLRRWGPTNSPPSMDAFNMRWGGHEGDFAWVETRVSGATKMMVTIADGPDDGDVGSYLLDVDEDTPNGWLGQHPDGTAQYTSSGSCQPNQGCPSSWLVQQSPAIVVSSPLLGRGGEYPYVLGMVSASTPGAMLVATSIMGPRDISDIDVNVDVNVDLNIGFDFF